MNSTEEYLDRLLRGVTGEPEPEPETEIEPEKEIITDSDINFESFDNLEADINPVPEIEIESEPNIDQVGFETESLASAVPEETNVINEIPFEDIESIIPTELPVVENIPVDIPIIEAPIEELSIDSLDIPMSEPVVEAVEEVPVIEPVTEVISEPVQELVSEPVIETVEEIPAVEPVIEAVEENPAVEPVIEAVEEIPAVEPIIQAVEETPVAEPTVNLEYDPADGAKALSADEIAAMFASMEGPADEAPSEPVQELVSEPVIETVEEVPVVEPVIEAVEEIPAVEPVIQAVEETPVAEPTVNLEYDPADGAKALSADEIAAMFASMEGPADEAPSEPVQEPVIETVEEIPAVEPVIEAVEESPVAAPTVTLEYDPADGAKALSEEEIAAMFASMEGPADEAASEPEPVQEPIEESVIEAVEETPAEEPAKTLEYDPADGAKALSEEEIAAMFASMEGPADEVASEPEPAQEPIAEPVIEAVEETPAAAPTVNLEYDPADEAKALSEEEIAAMFASMEGPADEAASEPEPVQEPIAEPVIEAVEETPAEEPAKTLEYDPADGAKALSEEEIAAMFASMEGPADEVASESEPVQEPIAEPVIEAVEETPAEEPTKTLEYDPADGAKALSEEEIAAMFASMEGPADEASSETAEEIVVDTDETLLSEEEPSIEAEGELGLEDLDGISDAIEENPEESSESMDDIPSAELPEVEEIRAEEEILEDNDIASLLQDIENMGKEEASASDDYSSSSSDAELEDLLAGSDDADMSEIGDILSKDENNVPIDDSIGLSDDLDFTSGMLSDEELFDDMEDIIEEEGKGKKKKSKKKKKKDKKDKDKPSLLARIIDFFIASDDDELEDGVKFEESAVDRAVEGAAENDAIMQELEAAGTDQPAKKDKKKKEKKKKEKKKKADDPAKKEKALEKQRKKEEKAKKKAEMKAAEAAIPKKKLPKKKVIPVCILCFSLGVVITLCAFLLPTSMDKKKALEQYDQHNYEATYSLLKGHSLSEKEQLMYDRTVTLLQEERKLDSYKNYMALDMKPEALNALVQGIKKYDELSTRATELEVMPELNGIYSQIAAELQNTFGIPVEKALQWINITDAEEYSYIINSYANGNGAQVENGMSSLSEDENVEMNVWGNSVISAEEAEIQQ